MPNVKQVTADTAGKLCSADFHGAELEVVRSRCVGRVGIRGIVVKDSKFCFELVTLGDCVKVVPKEHTIFRFRVPFLKNREGPEGKVDGNEGEGRQKEFVFELHGNQFVYRAADRANRKFKPRFHSDL